MRESNQSKPAESRSVPKAGSAPRRVPPKGGRRPQRMRLPFEHRPFDIGTWIYEHRVGLCCMVIAYLAFGIVFVSTNIVLNTQKYDNTLYVDLTDLQQQLMEEERRKEVEADLEAAIQKGRRCGMKEEEIRSLFELIMEDE